MKHMMKATCNNGRGMGKALLLLLILTMTVILSVQVFADGPAADLSGPGSVKPGDTIELKVNAYDLVGGQKNGVFGIETTIQYDKALLELVSAVAPSGWLAENGDRFMAIGSEPANSVLVMTFRVKADVAPGTKITVTCADTNLVPESYDYIAVGNLVWSATTPIEKSSDATLKALSVKGATINFKADTTSYKLTVENSVSALDITATPNHDKATVAIKNNSLVAGKTTDVQIVVTAEDGSTKTYTISVTREAAGVDASSDSTLKTIKVKGYVFNFVSTQFSYWFTVENNVERLEVTAEPNSSTATVEIDNPDLVEGDRTQIKIKVTAANGTTSTYTLYVTRRAKPDELSSDASLKSLKVAGVELSFSASKTQYTLNVPNSMSKLDITAVANHANAKVTIKNNSLTAGKAVDVQIVVTAENGETRTYHLNTTRAEKEPEKSSDNALKGLVIGGVSIDFKADKTEYVFEVAHDVAQLEITATPNHSAAKIEVRNNSLKAGETVTVSVIVTAEDGSTRTYSLKVTRKQEGAVTNPPDTTPPVTNPPDTSSPDTKPGETTGPDGTKPSETTGKPVVPPVTQDPADDLTQNQSNFWMNAIYIIILVGCLLVIALLVTLLIIYYRMNNNAGRM